MIINCIYITDNDMGIFELNAKLNIDTGQVFDIDHESNDVFMERKSYIEHITSQYIRIDSQSKEYFLEVKYNGGVCCVENLLELKEIDAVKLHNTLNKKLEEKEIKSINRKKI